MKEDIDDLAKEHLGAAFTDLEIMRPHQKIDELTGIISSARPTDNQPQR